MQFIDYNKKRGPATPDSLKRSYSEFTLELLKVEIDKTASIDCFHKTNTDGEFIFNNSIIEA